MMTIRVVIICCNLQKFERKKREMGKEERRRRVTRKEEKKLDGSFACQSSVDRRRLFFSFFIERT